MLYSSVFQVHFFSKTVIYIYIFFIFIFHDVGLIMIVEKKQSKYSCVLNNSSKFGGMISM